jgi:recombination protein RecR
MKYASPTLEKVVEAFSRLPGIGEKSAQRIALYLLREGKDEGTVLARSVLDLFEKVGRCSVCFNLAEEDPCVFCRDPERDSRTICVVEEPKDLMTIERTGGYRGLYHVLGGRLSPLEGIGEDQLKIGELLRRIPDGVHEVILATNPTMEGEMTAAHLAMKLKGTGVRVTRIARGVPFGGSLEFNDTVTVIKALEGRAEMPS